MRAMVYTSATATAAELHAFGSVLQVVPRAELETEARAFCTVIASKSRKALVIAKEALNGLEPRDVDRGYRWEQGFTLEMYMHEDSQKSRDAFVETGKAAEF
jgi:enoyl-CoA hydratase